MGRKITVCIGESDPIIWLSLEGKLLEFPEIKVMPKECAKKVKEFILNTPGDIVIMTYSDTPIEVIGEMISKGMIEWEEPQIFVKEKRYHYEKRGYLVDWCYGLFNHGEI